MAIPTTNQYWIRPDALTFSLNTPDVDYLRVTLLSGAAIIAYVPGTIDYDPSHNYRKWYLQAADTYLETTSVYYVHAQLTRSETLATALIVYSLTKRSVDGKIVAEDGTESGEADENYFYVYLGKISASKDGLGNKVGRTWLEEYNSGKLDTNQGRTEDMDGHYLSKLFNDTAAGLINFEKGIKFGNLLLSVDADNPNVLGLTNTVSGESAHFYAAGAISTKGLGDSSSGGGASALYLLNDVLPNDDSTGVSGAVEGSLLMYDGTHWKAGEIVIPEVDFTEVNGRIDALEELTTEQGESISSMNEKLTDFLEGTDTDNIINKWKELEAFLDGQTETSTLAELLGVKVNKETFDAEVASLTEAIGKKLDAEVYEEKIGSVDDFITAATDSLADLDDRVNANTANIATNTANIATNADNIATNTANIATNADNIATNTANIATNADNISANKTAIEAEVTRATEAEEALGKRLVAVEDWFTLEDGVLLTKYALAAEGAVSTKGIGDSSGGTGTSYDRLDSWDNYDASAGAVLSAVLGKELKDAIDNMEFPETDLSDYYTKAQVDEKVSALQEDIDGITIVSLMGNTAVGGVKAYAYWDGSKWTSKELGMNAFSSDEYFLASKFTQENIKSTLGISDWALADAKPAYTTNEVTEGDNLYFTDERAQAAVKVTTDALSESININAGSIVTLSGSVSTNAKDIASLGSRVTTNEGSIAMAQSNIKTLQGYFTSGVANSAAKLTTVSKKAWGQTYWTDGGVPDTIKGDMTDVGSITMSGSIKIGDGTISWDSTNKAFKFDAAVYSTFAIATKGVGDSSSGTGTGSTIELTSVPSNILPSEDSTYNLGSLDYTWKIIYADRMFVDGYEIEELATWTTDDLGDYLGSYVNTVTTTGSGNAVTSVSKNGNTVTVTKGSTFALSADLESYLPLSGGTVTGILTLEDAAYVDKGLIGRSFNEDGTYTVPWKIVSSTGKASFASVSIDGKAAATQEYVDEAIEGIDVSVDLSSYVKTTDLSSARVNYAEYSNNATYAIYDSAQQKIVDTYATIADNVSSGGTINLSSIAATTLAGYMAELGSNEVRLYLVTDSSGNLPSTSGETFITVSGTAKLLLFGKTASFGVSVGDILAVTNATCRIIPLNDAKPATSTYGNVGADGLMTVWDKGQVNQIASISTVAYAALPKADALPSTWLDNMDDALSTGVYPWCTLGRPANSAGAYTCVVRRSSTADANGYYTIEQTAYGREAELGQVYKRIIFWKDSSTYEYGDWIEVTNTGYATQDWVTNQGYVKSDAVVGSVTMNGNNLYPSSGKIDLGTVLTSHQTIYNLTMQAGAFSAVTFDPNGAAKTVNIPTKTSHLTNDSGFVTSSALSGYATTDDITDYISEYDMTVANTYLPLSGGTVTGDVEVQGTLEILATDGRGGKIYHDNNTYVPQLVLETSNFNRTSTAGDGSQILLSDMGTSFVGTIIVYPHRTSSKAECWLAATGISLLSDTGVENVYLSSNGDTSWIDGSINLGDVSADSLTVGGKSLATVATSGSYNDLSDLPTLGTAATLGVSSSCESGSTGLVTGATVYAHVNGAVAGFLTTSTAEKTYLTQADAASTYQPIGSYLTSHQTIKQDGITGATVNRYGTCATAATTAAKTVSITTGTFSLETGARVTVKFANANTASSPTLSVGSNGAKNIYHKGAQITSGSNKSLLAGTVDFVYDGTQWHLVGNYIDTNTNTTYSTAIYNASGLWKPAYSTTGAATLTTESQAYTNSPTIAARTTTAGRYYAVEIDTNGRAFVNVPWTDTNTNTTYSAGTGLTLSGTTFSLTNSSMTIAGTTVSLGGSIAASALKSSLGITDMATTQMLDELWADATGEFATQSSLATLTTQVSSNTSDIGDLYNQLDQVITTGNIGSQSVNYANNSRKLQYDNIFPFTDAASTYQRFARISLSSRCTGKHAVFNISNTRETSSTRTGSSFTVYVMAYQQDALGKKPVYSIKTDNDDRYYKVYGILNYDSTGCTLDVYLYGNAIIYRRAGVTLISGDTEVLSIASMVDELPSGTLITPGKMGSSYSATKLATARTIWGQSFDGSGDVSGSLILNNAYSIRSKDTNGNDLSLMELTKSDELYVGWGSAVKGYNTHLCGNKIILRYGTSTSTGLTLNSSGNVTIGSSDLASTNYKLYVDGATYISGATSLASTLSVDSYIYSRGDVIGLNESGSVQNWKISSAGAATFASLSVSGSMSFDSLQVGGYDVITTNNIGTYGSVAYTAAAANVAHPILFANNSTNTGNPTSGKVYYEANTTDGSGLTYNPSTNTMLFPADGKIGTGTSLSSTVNGLTLKVRAFYAPSTSSGSTYTTGKQGYVLISNGTTVYWGNTVANASYALKAAQDGNGKTITSTYATKTELASYISREGDEVSGIYGFTGIDTTDAESIYIDGNAIYGYIGPNGYGDEAEFTIYASGSATFYSVSQSSDARKKSILQDVRLSLDTMADAPLVQFDWIGKEEDCHHVGTIAQYWQSCLPEVVTETKNGFLALSYGELGVAMGISLAKEVMELTTRVNNEQSEIDKLKARIGELEERIALLESA